MSKVVRLHQPDALKLPLAGGAALELTPFRDSPHVALSLIGPARARPPRKNGPNNSRRGGERRSLRP